MAFSVPEPTNNLIPEGAYEVILRDGGYMDSTPNRTVYMSVPLTIRNDVEQDCKNQIVWDAIWTGSTDKHINFKVGNISKGVGIAPGTEYATIEEWGKALRGKVMKVTVVHEEYQGRTNARVGSYALTGHPDVKHVWKEKKKSVAVVPDEADFEEIPTPDDGDIPF